MLKQQARAIAALSYATDLGVTLAAVPVAYWLRNDLFPRLFPRLYPYGLVEFSLYLVAVGPIVVLWSLLFFLSNAYRSRRTLGLADEVSLVARVSFFGTLLLTLVVFAARWTFLSRSFLFVFFFVNLFFLVTARVTVRLLARRVRMLGFNYRTVVLVGDTPRARSMERLVHEHPWWGLRLLGLIRERPEGPESPLSPNGIPVLGTLADFEAIVRDTHVDEVILAVDRGDLPKLEDVFLLCEEMGIRTRLVLDFFPHVLARVELDEFQGTPLLTFSTTPDDPTALLLKRGVDVFLAVVLLIASVIPLAVAALFIKLTSRGPVLFRQTRCGLNGRPFTLLKLRTMVEGAEELLDDVAHLNEHEGPVFKAANDPRLTGVGRLIRRFSFDEFPQLWNVLRGEMSLVGPRPPLPIEVARYERWQRRRLSMKPGVTGLWQVSGRSDIRNFEEWINLDLAYIDNWSLSLDAKILLRTIPTVLTGRGAR
ncbi:MAG TPA: sugar transferase [Thermoanaerobaculia bacterium]|nr:sugar transferase [Thermoanaerobaculia bacterium]